jgi:hypothetical protein
MASYIAGERSNDIATLGRGGPAIDSPSLTCVRRELPQPVPHS